MYSKHPAVSMLTGSPTIVEKRTKATIPLPIITTVTSKFRNANTPSEQVQLYVYRHHYHHTMDASPFKFCSGVLSVSLIESGSDVVFTSSSEDLRG